VGEAGNGSGRPPTPAAGDQSRQTGAPTRTSTLESSGINDDRTRAVPRAPGPSRRRDDQLLVGRLTEHGRASYQFRADQDASYYLKLLTSRGSKTLWGKDLERALREADTRPKTGDLIGARRATREVVTVTMRSRDAEGRIVRQDERHAHRTRWVVEKVKFFADRARLARQLRDEQVDVRASVRAHPELKSAFLSVRAAEEFAAQRIADPTDRRRFLDLVRGAMAGSIQKGEPLPSVRLRNAQAPTQHHPPTSPNRKRDEPTR
jgi:hypothetical protein